MTHAPTDSFSAAVTSKTDVNQAPAPSAEDRGIGQVRRLEKAPILLVDDEPLVLRALERLLVGQGARVVSVTSIQAARTAIQRAGGGFEAAVVDYLLPNERGPNLVSELRRQATPCCALMIMGQREPKVAQEALAAGAHDFLFKPFDSEDFLSVVVRTVNRTRTWRARLDGFASEHLKLAGAYEASSAIEEVAPERVTQMPNGLPDLEICADKLAVRGRLSTREREILEHVLVGRRNSDIAGNLGITERTVKFHVANILRKLGAESRGDVLRLLFDPSNAGKS